MGVCRPLLQVQAVVQAKTCHFSHPFSVQTWPLKSIFLFRFGLYEIMSLRNRLEPQQKDFFKSIRIHVLFFLSWSSGIETAYTFIHSRSSVENHTRFQTRMGKVYSRFQTEKVQKPYPLRAAHTCMAYIREYLDPPPPRDCNCRLQLVDHKNHLPVKSSKMRIPRDQQSADKS